MAINKADVEFYFSDLVMQTAYKLSTKPWNRLSHNTKQKKLDLAVDIIHGLLNDEAVQAKLRLYLQNI